MSVIAFMSGKGGVGKTTISLNVAVSLARDFGKKISLIDTNLDTPHLTLFLGPRFRKDISDYKKGSIEKITFYHRFGFHFIPASFQERPYDLIPSVVEEAGEKFDVTILDTPPGLSESVELIMSCVEKVIPVVTLDPLSVIDAARLVKRAERMGKEVPGVVVNRVERKHYEVPIAKVYRIVKKKIIGMIPEDQRVKEAMVFGKPVVTAYPTSPASREIRRIAGRIIGVEWNPPGGNFLERVMRIFKR